MVLFKALACLSIYFALSVVPSNAKIYSYITNSMASDVYVAAGYNEADYVQKWKDEGNAINRALAFIYKQLNRVFGSAGDIEIIIATTGSNTCSYIYGEAERLENIQLATNLMPSKIIVVYTLNYADKDFAVEEYKAFKNAVKTLIDAGAKHATRIEVAVFQFRPVTEEGSTLQANHDYKNYGKTAMNNDQFHAQKNIINKLHTDVDENATITTAEFEDLMRNTKIRKVVDAMVESKVKTVDGDNQLLTAIPRAQIRIMATGVLGLEDKGDVLVICIDTPSGMDEQGDLTIDIKFWYPVDFILSSIWHKKLVNSVNFPMNPIALVLDIKYKGIRLIDELWKIISKDQATTPELRADVVRATASSLGVFAFVPDANDDNKMVIL